MAKKKKGWLDQSTGYSEPPNDDEDSGGMWAKSEPPPASMPPVGEDDSQGYGYGFGRPDSEPNAEPNAEPEEPNAETAGDAAETQADDASQASALAAAAIPAELDNDTAQADEPAKAEQEPSTDTGEAPGERTTTIGRTIIIRGRLTSDENLIVRGRIEAEINSSKDLLLENSGIINADMKVKSVTISGIVVGDIHALERVRLAPEARVVGDIYTPRLVVEDGATFRGYVEMEGLEHLEEVKPKKVEDTHAAADASAYDALNDPAYDEEAAPEDQPIYHGEH